MTYVTPLRHYPASGMNAAMRPLVEEATKALQAQGLNASMSRSLWAGDHPWFQIAIRYAKLADRDAADGVLAAWAAQYGPPELYSLSRQPPSLALWEVLQETNPGPMPRWAATVSATAAIGKTGELRSVLLEGGMGMEASGLNTALLHHVAGSAQGNAGSFARVTNFDTLADLEAWRAGMDFDSDYARRRDALLGAPLTSAIREVLIPHLGG